MKTKQFLGIVTLAALMMTSCSKDEVVSMNGNDSDYIGFSPYAGRPVITKGAGETNIDALKASGFGVFAFDEAEGNTQILNNQKVTWSDPNWVYSPKKLWEDKTISFFGYAPYAGAGIVLDQTYATPGLDYTLPAAHPENMLDIVAAQQIAQTKAEGAIKFAFKHVLSRVGFKIQAQGVASDYKVNLTGATLTVAEGSGLHQEATYNFQKTNENEANLGTWTYTTPLAGNSLVLPGEINKSTPTGTDTYVTQGFMLTGGQDAFLKAKVVDNQPKGDAYLYLIPSQSNIVGQKFTFKFDYDVIQPDPEQQGQWLSASKSKTVTLDGKAITFEAGKAYSLLFSLDLDIITFAGITVEPWGPETTL